MKLNKKTGLKSKKKEKELIGWREWVSLPNLGISKIKVKVDTGARTSSLHAYDIKIIKRRGKRYAQFKVCPYQRNTKRKVSAEALLRERRVVRSSSGHEEKRPTISTIIKLSDRYYPIDITLTNRDEMGFRMLLGRQAVRGNFIVDPSKSFIKGKYKPKMLKKKKKRGN